MVLKSIDYSLSPEEDHIPSLQKAISGFQTGMIWLTSSSHCRTNNNRLKTTRQYTLGYQIGYRSFFYSSCRKRAKVQLGGTRKYRTKFQENRFLDILVKLRQFSVNNLND
jgi:hypothetical protein